MKSQIILRVIEGRKRLARKSAVGLERGVTLPRFSHTTPNTLKTRLPVPPPTAWYPATAQQHLVHYTIPPQIRHYTLHYAITPRHTHPPTPPQRALYTHTPPPPQVLGAASVPDLSDIETHPGMDDAAGRAAAERIALAIGVSALKTPIRDIKGLVDLLYSSVGMTHEVIDAAHKA